MASPIHRLPVPILEKIILNLHEDRTASPSAVLPFLFTSKYFYTALGFRTNNRLYARLFRLCFDFSAPVHRLGPINALGFSIQLRVNYSALKCIRRSDIHANDILRTFWTAFSMLIENDDKNYCQLDAAGLPEFVDRFIRERLFENSINGWPADNEINSLALWLLWLTMTNERLESQTRVQSEEMAKLISSYTLMPVRYAAYFAPHVHHIIPLAQNPTERFHTFVTAHGDYPHYRDGFLRTIRLYHINDIKLGIPLASIAAKLVAFLIVNTNLIGIPTYFPTSRADASQVFPTQDDIREFNRNNIARFVPKSTWEWWSEIAEYDKFECGVRSELAPSARWDDDWNRLADCTDVFRPIALKRPRYTPGLLCGLWQGWMLCPDNDDYENLIQTTQIPDAFDEWSVGLTFKTVFMRLREYRCMDVEPNEPAPSGGIQNAWFHSPTQFQEQTTSHYNEFVAGGPDLHDKSECRRCKCRVEQHARYSSMLDDILASERTEDTEGDDEAAAGNTNDVNAHTVAGEELVLRQKCNGILDIIVVGETDPRHGQAWHYFKFFGRIREWDGLVALMRIPTHGSDASHDVLVFTGYVVGGQNFVSNWRTTAKPGELVTSEGAFVMSKRE